MKIEYKTWLVSYKELNTEKGSVGRWDLWNKTKYKQKVEAGKLTSEDVAKENHANGLGYEFCVFENEDDEFPYAYVTVVPENKHVGVNFIDPAGREYLTYLFHEINLDRKLFIREVWYFNFPNEQTEDEDYRLHFVFDKEGNVDYRKYDEVNKKMLDYEGKEKMDISGLYEDYPSFGNYEGVLQLEREFPIDLQQ